MVEDVLGRIILAERFSSPEPLLSIAASLPGLGPESFFPAPFGSPPFFVSASEPMNRRLRDIRLNDGRSGPILSLTFKATGHPAVRSSHPSTIEITRESYLTTRGDCVVAVNASMGPVNMPAELKRILSTSRTKIRLVLTVDDLRFVVKGQGDPRLTLSHPTEFVIRKSGFISDRTLMIYADKSACDVPRDMVRLLRNPTKKVMIEIAAAP